MLRGMHKGATHLGKVPEGLIESHFRIQRIEELQAKLDQAIASESYEEAAELRDEIRKLDETGVEK
jgi:protein arginine kinase activator